MSVIKMVFTSLLLLQLSLGSLGIPDYYDYNTGRYVFTPERTYYDNPFDRYRSSNPYSGQVYITDQYGQTMLSGSSYSPYSRARALSYTGCSTCDQTKLSQTKITMCSGSLCGNNAHCTTIGNRPVCSCLKGYIGDPLYNCIRAECLSGDECSNHLTCKDNRCTDPCLGACASTANCAVKNHIPVCSCPPGFTGNPFTNCRRFDPDELCHPNPCGANALCQVVNEVPTCKCLPGYHGSPITGCRHECEVNTHCLADQACIDFKCQNPCSLCGTNAECNVANHTPVCSCPKGYLGDPFKECRPECTSHSDCPASKPACFYHSCKNPCDNVCGVNANCELRNGITPVCSCPKDMTGDPFTFCRPFTKNDLCEPNPCGANAKCEPGYDKYNKERPVCTCHPGYIGDPITGCVRGECQSNIDCRNNQACFEYKCENPCRGQCGINAVCNPRNHIAVCTCLEGYNGDALTQCYRSEAIPVKTSNYYSCSTC
ncbi:hypothetical protein FQA39_LY15833 [Lamprigera yunnana]|nr:hypothetical protein FQA39_LY15833 [Lamprigera yunnana]